MSDMKAQHDARRARPFWYVYWLDPQTGQEGRTECADYDAVTSTCRVLNERNPLRWYQARYDEAAEIANKEI